MGVNLSELITDRKRNVVRGDSLDCEMRKGGVSC